MLEQCKYCVFFRLSHLFAENLGHLLIISALQWGWEQSAPERRTASRRAGPRQLCSSVLQVILELRRQILGKLSTFLWKDSGSWATGPALSPVFFLSFATSSRSPLDSEAGKCAHELLTCWPGVWRTRLTAWPSGKAAKDRERRLHALSSGAGSCGCSGQCPLLLTDSIPKKWNCTNQFCYANQHSLLKISQKRMNSSF